MQKLDKKDKQLLTLLYLNSRMSFTQLGKELKLNSSSVERRLRQLKNSGTISSLFADVNLAKLGFKGYRIYLKFDVFDEKTEKDVLALFESYSRTLWGAVCEGAYDVLWRIIARDELEVEDAINLVTEKFGKSIVEKTVATTTYQTYLSWNRALEGERHPEFPLEKVAPAEKLDMTDMKILASLYNDARATTVDMAQQVGLTPDAVNYRMKRLTKEGFILGYTAWFDAKKLGFEYYKILISFRGMTQEKEKKFLDFCLEHNNVIFLNKCIGSWDIEVDIIVENTLELHRFITEIKTKFGHIIGNHKYVSAIEERMLNPIREYMSDSNGTK
ncbi:MAG: Lrp/AsnC family transcriptional regulator [Candidatus Micrarchaeota archaeon]|nr:Lrp/AsnC family transcriptional regulator [Candidatus Micrarchaeota archaeon]